MGALRVSRRRLHQVAGSEADNRWIEFFKNPGSWLDNRRSNNRTSDFTHAATGEALSIASCPKSLQGKLALLQASPAGFRACYQGTAAQGSVFRTGYQKTTGGQKTAPQFVAALKRCSKMRDLESGKKLHREVVEAGFHTNKFVASVLVAMYSKCRSMALAQQVFDSLMHRDVVIWTSLIVGYVENGESSVALDLFNRMDCDPNSVTYVAALKACGALASDKPSEKKLCLEKGMAIHKQVRDKGMDSELVVATTLLDMYSKCGSMQQARQIFDAMRNRSAVTWTSIILGYVENGESSVALDLFARMDCEPDSVTYVAILKACVGLAGEKESEKQQCLEKGIAIHNEVKNRGFESDLFMANSLVGMYSKCGSMQRARDVFDRIKSKDVVTWNSLILGYLENGDSSMAMELFMKMECEANSVTYVSALKACGSLAALRVGQQIHAVICKLGLEQDRVLATALMDFYQKCGSMSKAEEVFDNLHSLDLVCWNALISGYSSFGDSYQVFTLVKKMQLAGFRLDGVTFISILTACSHAGLAEEGKLYFDSMLGYGVKPSLQHYNCMIDLLGRANRLQEALDLINSMPFAADSITWRTLLAACKNWKNLEVGKVAFDALMAAAGTDAGGAYVLMRDIYGSSHQDEEDLKGHSEQDLKDSKQALIDSKATERSCWCDSRGKTLEFGSGDTVEQDQAAQKLRQVLDGDYKSDTGFKDPACGHSEKLAIAHALLHSAPGEVIRIVKNARMCSDCHNVVKQISKVEKRELILRDASRFHVFRNGKCSCADFW